MPLLSSLTSVRKSKGKQEEAPRSDADSWQTQLLLAFQLLMVATGADPLLSKLSFPVVRSVECFYSLFARNTCLI